MSKAYIVISDRDDNSAAASKERLPVPSSVEQLPKRLNEHSNLGLQRKLPADKKPAKQHSKRQVMPPSGGGNLHKPGNPALNISVDIKNKGILNQDIANQIVFKNVPVAKVITRHIRAAT